MDAKELQAGLHNLAFEVGEESNRLFFESFLEDWPDEEATTGALFGALVSTIKTMSGENRASSKYGIKLRAQLTKKRDEAEHGADVFVRFSCNEPHWQIQTTTVIQAKKLDLSRPMTSGDHTRLSDQLGKMLARTTESFVLVYSSQGIQALPAVAAQALKTKQLFDADMISWQWFLSGIFRGRMGETNSDRLPANPRIDVAIIAQAAEEEPKTRAMTAGG